MGQKDFRSQISDLRSQISDLKYDASRSQSEIWDLGSEIRRVVLTASNFDLASLLKMTNEK